MVQVIWATDPHLDYAPLDVAENFIKATLEAAKGGVILLGGDIGESDSVFYWIEKFNHPFFVLGNHDYYSSDINTVRLQAQLTKGWLENYKYPIDLGDGVALVGCDGWGDGRFGDPYHSNIYLNDWIKIADFHWQDRNLQLRQMARLADKSAAHLHEVLPTALREFKEVVILTHVPPFVEASWHNGQLSDANGLPWFVCRATGEAIKEISAAHGGAERITVLCGHTHSSGECYVEGIRIITGEAEYGHPGFYTITIGGKEH